MQATYLLPEKHARLGSERASAKLVELDSAPAPVGSALAFGAQHSAKPFQLTHAMRRLRLEPKRMQTGGSFLMWQGMGLGAKHKVVGPCDQQRSHLRTPGSSRDKAKAWMSQLVRILWCCPMDWFMSTSHIYRRMSHGDTDTHIVDTLPFDQDRLGLLEKIDLLQRAERFLLILDLSPCPFCQPSHRFKNQDRNCAAPQQRQRPFISTSACDVWCCA